MDWCFRGRLLLLLRLLLGFGEIQNTVEEEDHVVEYEHVALDDVFGNVATAKEGKAGQLIEELPISPAREGVFMDGGSTMYVREGREGGRRTGINGVTYSNPHVFMTGRTSPGGNFADPTNLEVTADTVPASGISLNSTLQAGPEDAGSAASSIITTSGASVAAKSLGPTSPTACI